MSLKGKERVMGRWGRIGTSVKIVSVYVVFRSLWILFSDRLMAYFVASPVFIFEISLLKGWLFVLVTGLLLLRLIHRSFGQIQGPDRQLEDQNEELRATNQEIRGPL